MTRILFNVLLIVIFQRNSVSKLLDFVFPRLHWIHQHCFHWPTVKTVIFNTYNLLSIVFQHWNLYRKSLVICETCEKFLCVPKTVVIEDYNSFGNRRLILLQIIVNICFSLAGVDGYSITLKNLWIRVNLRQIQLH